MTGVFSSHAGYKLAQLETEVREASAELERVKGAYADAVERYSKGLDDASWFTVKNYDEGVAKARVRLQGAEITLIKEREKHQMQAFREVLAAGDSLEVEVRAERFVNDFAELHAPRIEKLAASFIELLTEIEKAAEIEFRKSCKVVEIATDLGFRELVAGRRFHPTPEEVHSMVRAALKRGLKGGNNYKLQAVGLNP